MFCYVHHKYHLFVSDGNKRVYFNSISLHIIYLVVLAVSVISIPRNSTQRNCFPIVII